MKPMYSEKRGYIRIHWKDLVLLKTPPEGLTKLGRKEKKQLVMKANLLIAEKISYCN